MLSKSCLVLSVLVLVAACSARQTADGDGGPIGVQEWSPCVSKDDPDTETCATVCAAMGTTCVATGCAAVAENCDPEPCDMATQVLALDAAALCADASAGLFVASTCDEPIDWLFSNTLRCCCAEDE
jgi:hypothetical protein